MLAGDDFCGDMDLARSISLINVVSDCAGEYIRGDKSNTR